MKYWKGKEKMILIIIFILAFVLLLGIFIGRLSARNIYELFVNSEILHWNS